MLFKLIGFEGIEYLGSTDWELRSLMAEHVEELLKLSSKMKWVVKTRL